MEPLLVMSFGAFAGALTTIAGMGGGLILLLSLSAIWGPAAALAVTSPALLVGNLHRAFLYRRSVNWGLARAFAVGAAPGALLGALAAVAVPPALVSALMALVTLLSVLRAVGWLRVRPPARLMTPAGAVIGGLTGTSGGAAVLTAPLFLSAGLVGESYVGTTAVSAVVMHFGRMTGYGMGGLFTAERVAQAALLAIAVLTGNVFGRKLRRHADRLPEGLLEHVVLVACVALALLGVGRG